MTTWITIASTPTPSTEVALVSGTHMYRVRGVCANGTVEPFRFGLWVTR